MNPGRIEKGTFMLYVKESESNLEDVCKRLETAAQANNFGVLAVHDLKEKMVAKGVSFDAACRVFEVCNPVKAKAVLETNMSIANALPCRICVYEEYGKVKVSTLKPTELIALFNSPSLQGVAREVEDALIRIIDASV